MKIKYRDGYKYQLAESVVVPTAMKDFGTIATEFITLQSDGVLQISKGYAWDGPSGLTFDTLDFMSGSLVHDVFYQLLREGHLPQDAKSIADDELRRICLEDGMSEFRAKYVHDAVMLFGGPSAKLQKEHILEAP